MLCFCIQRAAPNLASQALRNDGFRTVLLESSLHCNYSFYLFLARVLLMEFHCVLQLLDGCVAGGVVGISLCFAASGSFPPCKWHFMSG